MTNSEMPAHPKGYVAPGRRQGLNFCWGVQASKFAIDTKEPIFGPFFGGIVGLSSRSKWPKIRSLVSMANLDACTPQQLLFGSEQNRPLEVEHLLTPGIHCCAMHGIVLSVQRAKHRYWGVQTSKLTIDTKEPIFVGHFF